MKNCAFVCAELLSHNGIQYVLGERVIGCRWVSMLFYFLTNVLLPTQSTQLLYKQHTTYITYRRIGSNPISPGMDPSSLSGTTKKGTAFENCSALSATEVARCCK
ncbi:MAG: hypothetical protein ACI8RD_000224 [Bacillariaceae sp.]|jgi:hypothetical protein